MSAAIQSGWLPIVMELTFWGGKWALDRGTVRSQKLTLFAETISESRLPSALRSAQSLIIDNCKEE